MASSKRVSPGDLVVAADGEELGKVKEVQETCFKVSPRKGRDYWLANDAVLGREGKTALLCFDKEHLEDARILTEEHAGAHRHSGSGGSSGLFGSSRLLLLIALGAMVLGKKERREKVIAAANKAVDKVKSKSQAFGENVQTSGAHEY